jgi:anti-sigma B factor antagonist
MTIEIDKQRNVNVLRLSGRLTVGRGDTALRDTFRALLRAGERFFIFDMTALTHMDSAGVGETVACYKRACDAGGVIKVVLPPDGRTRQLFALTYLDRVFQVFTDTGEALASFPA